MHTAPSGQIDATGLRIGIAVSQYYQDITRSMRDSAVETYLKAGGAADGLMQIEAAGAFELTAIARALAALHGPTGKPALDAIVALGCIITGQTTHDQYIANAVTHGLTSITVQTGVPIAFGVLTCQTLQQARERTLEAENVGHRNKGAEAMIAAIRTATTLRSLSNTKERRS